LKEHENGHLWENLITAMIQTIEMRADESVFSSIIHLMLGGIEIPSLTAALITATIFCAVSAN
jgi:hypothetical protein